MKKIIKMTSQIFIGIALMPLASISVWCMEEKEPERLTLNLIGKNKTTCALFKVDKDFSTVLKDCWNDLPDPIKEYTINIDDEIPNIKKAFFLNDTVQQDDVIGSFRILTDKDPVSPKNNDPRYSEVVVQSALYFADNLDIGLNPKSMLGNVLVNQTQYLNKIMNTYKRQPQNSIGQLANIIGNIYSMNNAHLCDIIDDTFLSTVSAFKRLPNNIQAIYTKTTDQQELNVDITNNFGLPAGYNDYLVCISRDTRIINSIFKFTDNDGGLIQISEQCVRESIKLLNETRGINEWDALRAKAMTVYNYPQYADYLSSTAPLLFFALKFKDNPKVCTHSFKWYLEDAISQKYKDVIYNTPENMQQTSRILNDILCMCRKQIQNNTRNKDLFDMLLIFRYELSDYIINQRINDALYNMIYTSPEWQAVIAHKNDQNYEAAFNAWKNTLEYKCFQLFLVNGTRMYTHMPHKYLFNNTIMLNIKDMIDASNNVLGWNADEKMFYNKNNKKLNYVSRFPVWSTIDDNTIQQLAPGTSVVLQTDIEDIYNHLCLSIPYNHKDNESIVCFQGDLIKPKTMLEWNELAKRRLYSPVYRFIWPCLVKFVVLLHYLHSWIPWKQQQKQSGVPQEEANKTYSLTITKI